MNKLWIALALLIGSLTAISVIMVIVASTMAKQEAYTWSSLYLGSAVVSAIASLVTIPFAIWALIMQSRYGPYVLSIFFYKIINLFILLILSVLITGVAMVYSFLREAYVVSYVAIIIESVVIIPVIAMYVLKLMTLKPHEVVNTVVKGSTSFSETIALLFKLANIYIQEAVEENVVLMIMKRALTLLRSREADKNAPTPAVWHELRAFIDTIIKKDVPLPSRRLMGALLREFALWLLKHRKDRAVAMLLRHFRRLAIKYLEIRLPTDVVRDLLIKPIIEPVESIETKPELRALAYEQLYAFLRHVRNMALRGEITKRELCSCIAVLGKSLTSFEECEALEHVREYISVLDREFRCRAITYRAPRRRPRVNINELTPTSREDAEKKPSAMGEGMENPVQRSDQSGKSAHDEVRPV